MIRGLLFASVIGAGLVGAGPQGLGPEIALAQKGCLSAGEARSAVASGQAIPLSSIAGQLRAGGGRILPPPQLCNRGGRLVYIVNVLGKGGKVKRVVVDAATGGY